MPRKPRAGKEQSIEARDLVPISLASFFLIGAVASLVLWVEETRKFFARRSVRDCGAAMKGGHA